MTDPDRRKFFREFAGDVMSSVGSVIGAAQVLQQQSAEAARELLGTGPEPGAGPDGGSATAEQPAAGAGFRAPFRWDGDVCRVVDQRRLPDVLADLEVRGAADAVNAIRSEAIVGAPAQAQLAVITLSLIADRSAASRPFARRATLRGAGNALRNSRAASVAMITMVERMIAVLEAFDLQADGGVIAAAMRWEAETIIRETTDSHGALVERVQTVLPGEADAPLHVLTIGSTGPMGGGQLGTAGSAIIAAHHAGRPIHALVAETRPGMAGSRILAWELREAGVAHAVVTDAAAPGCIAAGEVAAVVVGADRVTANGDVIAVAGTYPLALAAAAAGVPVIVCATTTTFDLALASGEDAPVEQGAPGRVVLIGEHRVAPEGTQVRSPLQDVTPASLIGAIVTEQGVLRPPFEAGIAAHAEAAAVRAAAVVNPWIPVAATVAPEPAGTAMAGEAAGATQTEDVVPKGDPVPTGDATQKGDAVQTDDAADPRSDDT